MRRRVFIATASGVVAGAFAGCSEPESVSNPQIRSLEVANHRHDEPAEFVVRIEADDEVVFEATEELAPGDPQDGVALFERPVSGPGAYEVTVEAADHNAAVDTAQLDTSENDCLYLEFYLSASALHAEHVAWPCENEPPE